MTRTPDLGRGRPKSMAVGIRLTPEEYERLAEQAQKAERNVGSFVRELVVLALKEREQ